MLPKLGGMDLAFVGNVPQGAGLSSSAALEVATAEVARALLGFDVKGPALARLCQRAENDFVGMKCGIMDQFISLMGRAGNALLVDCRSLAHELVPLELGDQVIAIVDSGVKHALVDSQYNRRREECAEGVAALRRRFPGVAALRDALGQKAQQYADIVKIGRTHLQDAVPLTLGQEFSGYVAQLHADLERIEHAMPGLYELAIGGTAVGTGLNAHPDFGPRTIAALADATGIAFRPAADRSFAAVAAACDAGTTRQNPIPMLNTRYISSRSTCPN